MMKPDFVLLGLGALLLLFLGIGFTVSYCVAPFSLSQTVGQLVILVPFSVSTFRMLVLFNDMLPDFEPTVAVTASLPGDPGQGYDEDYEDIIDDVTIVHDL